MTYEGHSRARAHSTFQWARSRAYLQDIIARLSGKSNDLLSYDDVRHKLRGQVSSRRELRDIPLSAIVGSVGRYTDFTRAFLPRRPSDAQRWTRVATAMAGQEGTPPIEVYQIGEVYFVLDGNHRVSVARQSGATHIEAYVTPVRTRVRLGPDTSPDELILKAELADFLDATDIDRIRPGVDLRVTNPGQYRALMDDIEDKRRELSQRLGREATRDEAVAAWHDEVYQPIVALIRERGLLRGFPGRTETDMYVWVSRHRARLEESLGWEIDPEDAAADLEASHAGPAIGERLLSAITPGLAGGPAAPRRRERQAGPPDRIISADLLVAISGEPDGWRALDQAIIVTRREGGRLNGLHVIPSGARPEEAAQEVRRTFERRCREAGVAGSLAVVAGGPVSQRISERARWNDLVIVSLSHPPGPGAVSRLRPGFHTLVQRCPRPILAVPRAATELRSGLLCYDGSKKADEALFIAAYLGLQWQMALVVVTVIEEGADAAALLARTRRYLESQGVAASYRAVEAESVAGGILGAAREHGSDMIMMGGYGRSPLLEAVLGGAVDRVLRESERPVLICR